MFAIILRCINLCDWSVTPATFCICLCGSLEEAKSAIMDYEALIDMHSSTIEWDLNLQSDVFTGLTDVAVEEGFAFPSVTATMTYDGRSVVRGFLSIEQIPMYKEIK